MILGDGMFSSQQARGSGERCKLAQWRRGRSPGSLAI